ncbi:sulfotransferase, partial [Rheinheimera sp.]|uniref:sulfotransferase n=1 Tax=Rheinheimera sp. TaxID=1869214 RepID=UPI00262C0D1B
HYYLAYRRLMNYWQQQLPQKILTIDYELLVTEQQQQSKKLLEFLDLPWQEQCLDFHQNIRSVHTVSNSQVRQPMFQSSVGSWKKYQSQLAGLAAELEAQL